MPGCFQEPVFMPTVAIYTAGMGPPNAPRVTCQGNLVPGERSSLGMMLSSSQNLPSPVMQLLLPPFTDVRGQNSSTGSDTINCPAGSNRWYTVLWCDDYSKSFPTEHRFCWMVQNNPFYLDGGNSLWQCVSYMPAQFNTSIDGIEHLVEVSNWSATATASGSPLSPFAEVQYKAGQSTGSGSFTINWTTTTTSGNTLILCIGTTTGSAGGTSSGFTSLQGEVGANGDSFIMYYSPDASAQSNTTFTFTSGTPTATWGAIELSGCHASNPNFDTSMAEQAIAQLQQVALSILAILQT